MPELSEALRDAAKLLANASNVTVLCHVKPDADTFGSAVALAVALRDRGADVRISFGSPDRVPAALRVLDPGDLFVPAAALPAELGLLVTVDVAGVDQFGVLTSRITDAVAAGQPVLVIDHHRSNPRFGTHHVIDITAEANTVLVLRLLDELGAPLSEPIARALYGGLYTDTGCFLRARPSTHQIAARLLATGVDAATTARALTGQHPFDRLRMLAAVLGRAQLEPTAAHGLGLVHTVVLLDDLAELPAEEADSVINIVRDSAEPEVAAVFKQAGPNRWTVSMRSISRIDVSAAAVALGGGGHRLAAGFTTDGTLAEVTQRLRIELAAAPLL